MTFSQWDPIEWVTWLYTSSTPIDLLLRWCNNKWLPLNEQDGFYCFHLKLSKSNIGGSHSGSDYLSFVVNSLHCPSWEEGKDNTKGANKVSANNRTEVRTTVNNEGSCRLPKRLIHLWLFWLVFPTRITMSLPSQSDLYCYIFKLQSPSPLNYTVT